MAKKIITPKSKKWATRSYWEGLRYTASKPERKRIWKELNEDKIFGIAMFGLAFFVLKALSDKFSRKEK